MKRSLDMNEKWAGMDQEHHGRHQPLEDETHPAPEAIASGRHTGTELGVASRTPDLQRFPR